MNHYTPNPPLVQPVFTFCFNNAQTELEKAISNEYGNDTSKKRSCPIGRRILIRLCRSASLWIRVRQERISHTVIRVEIF